MDKNSQELFVVRHYDGFDNMWMDVTRPVPREEADRILNENTENGTKNTNYDDIDYYAIFPADTIMHFSYEAEERRKNGSRKRD